MNTSNETVQNWELVSTSGAVQKPPKASALHNMLLILWMAASVCVFFIGLQMTIDGGLHQLARVAVIGAAGIIYIFAVATHTTHRRARVLAVGLILIAAALLLYFLPNYVGWAFRIITGLVGLLFGLLLFLDVWREVKVGTHYGGSLFWALVYTGLSIAVLFTKDGSRLLAILTGVYLMVFSGNVLFEALYALFYQKPRLKRNLVLALPTAVSAFLPIAMFQEINTMVREDPDKVLYLQEPDEGPEPDLIVYVHTRAGLIPGFGHCDLCFDGKVYSYGDYDEATWKFGGFFADGVMALIPPQKHIEMALKVNKKILAAYGITLTPELKKQVRGKIDEIMSMAYLWESNTQLAQEGKLDGAPDSYNDVGSQMWRDEDAVMYKFKEGSPYKVYYGIGENCSKVVNDVVGYSGIGLLQPNGVITPGSYLEYLDELYRMDGTIVTDRRIYMLDKDGKPVELHNKPAQPLNVGTMSM